MPESSLYVNASDDESDDERDRIFFAREAALRKENTSANSESNVPGPLQLTRKRKGEELHETPRTFDADITNDKESTRQQSKRHQAKVYQLLSSCKEVKQ